MENVKKWYSNNTSYFISFFSILAFCLFLVPIINNIYYSDDSFIYLNAQILKHNHLYFSIWDYSLKEIKAWVITSGRFNPFALFLTYYLLFSIEQPIYYKIVLYLGNIIAMIPVILFFRKWIPKFKFTIFLIILCTTIQFCIRYHDAYNSFGLMYPSVVFFGFLSLYFLLDYIQYNQIKYLLYSIISLIISNLFIETAFVFFALIFVVLIQSKSKLSIWLPYLVLFISYVAFLIFIKYNLNGDPLYPGLQPDFNFNEVSRTFLIQLKGSLPLKTLFHRDINFLELKSIFSNNKIILFLLFSVSFCTLIYYKNIEKIKFKLSFYFFIFCLIVFPAVFISISDKYQTQLNETNYYIAVYIQIIGIALLIYSLFLNIKWLRYIFICVIPMIVCITYCLNVSEINLGKKLHFQHMYIIDFLKKNATVFDSKKDTLFGYNLWIEKNQMTDLLYAATNKKIEYKAINNVDSMIHYKRLIIYNPEKEDSNKLKLYFNY